MEKLIESILHNIPHAARMRILELVIVAIVASAFVWWMA